MTHSIPPPTVATPTVAAAAAAAPPPAASLSPSGGRCTRAPSRGRGPHGSCSSRRASLAAALPPSLVARPWLRRAELRRGRVPPGASPRRPCRRASSRGRGSHGSCSFRRASAAAALPLSLVARPWLGRAVLPGPVARPWLARELLLPPSLRGGGTPAEPRRAAVAWPGGAPPAELPRGGGPCAEPRRAAVLRAGGAPNPVARSWLARELLLPPSLRGGGTPAKPRRAAVVWPGGAPPAEPQKLHSGKEWRIASGE